MYKEDLALNNLQWLICHKTRQNQTKSPKLAPQHLMQFNLISKRVHFLRKGVLPLYRGYSRHILSPTNKVDIILERTPFIYL